MRAQYKVGSKVIPKNLVRKQLDSNVPCNQIEFDVDKDWLLDKALKCERKQFYHHGRKEEKVEGYKYAHISYPELEIMAGANGLNLNCKYNMKFVFIAPNATIGWHKDWGTKCAFNWVINDNRAAIRYSNGQEGAQLAYVYNSALINTQEEHMVQNNDKERILFKISIFDRSYEEICNKFNSRFM